MITRPPPRAGSWLPLVAIAVITAGLAGCGNGGPDVAASSPGPVAPPRLPDAGAVLLDEPFDDDSNGWGVLHDPKYGSADYAEGHYVWKATGHVVSLVPAILGEQFDAGRLSMSDVVMDADVTIDDGGGVVGLQCRNSPDTDAGYQWYDFVARDSYVAIRLSDDGSTIEVLAQRSDVSIPTGELFSIGAACLTAGGDVQLSMAINDRPVLATTVPAKATDGVPGIVGWSFPVQSELAATWDRFRVSRPA